MALTVEFAREPLFPFIVELHRMGSICLRVMVPRRVQTWYRSRQQSFDPKRWCTGTARTVFPITARDADAGRLLVSASALVALDRAIDGV